MRPLPPFGELSSICDEARVLVQRARDHERQLEAAVVAARRHLHRHEEALADALAATQRSGAECQRVLSTQVRGSQDRAEIAEQIYDAAHEQRIALDLLLTHLERHVAPLQDIEERSRGYAVLVVDDYGDVREAIADVLRDAGFRVSTAANGLQGLLAAHEIRPDVVVMDLAMPVLDGITATRLIKANDATRQTPVIAYSATPLLDQDLLHTLFSAVVQKPATPAALLATVRQVANL